MIKLSEQELKELTELYRKAQTTPDIKMSMLSPSWAQSAWNNVRQKMDELGKKYGFNPSTIKGIRFDTGEVITEP